ncbi:TfoX/Sxy family protein [Streptomyces olivoreticuli]
MPYDKVLAERVLERLEPEGVVAKKMFGTIAYLLQGNIVVTLYDDGLWLRVGPDGVDEALSRDASLQVTGPVAARTGPAPSGGKRGGYRRPSPTTVSDQKSADGEPPRPGFRRCVSAGGDFKRSAHTLIEDSWPGIFLSTTKLRH